MCLFTGGRCIIHTSKADEWGYKKYYLPGRYYRNNTSQFLLFALTTSCSSSALLILKLRPWQMVMCLTAVLTITCEMVFFPL